jgi:tRNA pseudouridine13 synthase
MSNYLTGALPGTGGTIKEIPEDFLVEEIPLYAPCGDGEHLYLRVEKCGITTFDLLQRLARALGVRERDIGYAGLKDARATTRQTLSLTGVTEEQALALDLEGIRILSAARHRNKLRLGHLAGNRFTIRVRQVGAEALEQALDVLSVLQDIGVPNRFGQQRYGSLGNSHTIGGALLRGDHAAAAAQIVGDPAAISNERWRQGAEAFAAGDYDTALAALPARFRDERRMIQMLKDGRSAKEAVLALPNKLLRLYLSAYQASLFDRMVDMRLATLDRLWAGDLAFKHDNGACFLVEDPEVEQVRADRFEISPTAPFRLQADPGPGRSGAPGSRSPRQGRGAAGGFSPRRRADHGGGAPSAAGAVERRRGPLRGRRSGSLLRSPSGELRHRRAARGHENLGACRTSHEPAAKSSIWSISELLFDQ